MNYLFGVGRWIDLRSKRTNWLHVRTRMYMPLYQASFDESPDTTHSKGKIIVASSDDKASRIALQMETLSTDIS